MTRPIQRIMFRALDVPRRCYRDTTQGGEMAVAHCNSPPSMDATYVDPPLGRTVVSNEMADIVSAIEASDRLESPISLRELMLDRPYQSSVNFLREQEAYFSALDRVRDDLDSQYDTILIVGGSGALVDLANNFRVHDLILLFRQLGKPIAAECYGVSCLAFARDTNNRSNIIAGKHVTGHCIEYDYKEGTGFLGTDFVMGPRHTLWNIIYGMRLRPAGSTMATWVARLQ